MRAQVYIDFMIVVALSFAFITFIILSAMRINEQIVKDKVKEEFELVGQQVATILTRLAELGKKNPIKPSINSTLLLGVYDIELPSRILNRNYELRLISPSKLWVNVRSFTFAGEEVNYAGSSPNAVIAMHTIQPPEVSFEQHLPNLGIELEGLFRSGMPGVIRYYRHNLDGKIFDVMVLSSHLIIHLEELS